MAASFARNRLRVSRLALPVVLAAALTAADALKPPVIDDTAYLALARQMARDPLDPYGFEQFWYSEPEPANHVLAPPVLPYWLSIGIRLFGEQPVLLKLWLFPVALLFTISLQSLLRRFARPAAEPMLVLAVFSPAVLPGFNFMIDLPSLTLSLASMAVYFRALAYRSWRLAILAGLIAGLAMETKYIGFLTPPLLLVAGLLRRRLAPGLIAAAMAMLVFAAWESFMSWKYGESHFLFHLNENPFKWEEKRDLTPWLITLLGALAPGIAIAAMARWRIAAIASTLILCLLHAKLSWLATRLDQRLARFDLGLFGLGLTEIYFALGLATILGLGAALIHQSVWNSRWLCRSRRTWFLLIWVAAEVAGYFAMSPFPASRRILGLTIALTLLAARVMASSRRQRRDRLWFAIWPGVALGIYFALVDTIDSRLEPALAKRAAEFIRERDRSPRIWFVGHWGFQFEAERQGMRPLAPGRSLLRRGDWLVWPDASLNQQDFKPDSRMGPPVQTIEIGIALKRSTRPDYYGGPWPMVVKDQLRLTATVYRIQDTWSPQP